MAPTTCSPKQAYTAMISQNGNFGDLFWDSQNARKMMCGVGDGWSMSNNASEPADEQDKKQGSSNGEVPKKQTAGDVKLIDAEKLQDVAEKRSFHEKP